jgi:hypothetical protein
MRKLEVLKTELPEQALARDTPMIDCLHRWQRSMSEFAGSNRSNHDTTTLDDGMLLAGG